MATGQLTPHSSHSEIPAGRLHCSEVMLSRMGINFRCQHLHTRGPKTHGRAPATATCLQAQTRITILCLFFVFKVIFSRDLQLRCCLWHVTLGTEATDPLLASLALTCCAAWSKTHSMWNITVILLYQLKILVKHPCGNRTDA